MNNFPPSGTLTFLFTEIEDSTNLWELYGEVIEQDLAEHDRLLRHNIEK